MRLLERVRSPRAWPLVVAAVVVAGTVIRIPQLFHTLAEAYAFRQTQTAFVAREFAERGIDLSQTPLPVFGVASDVPMEFPLWQGAAALLMMAGVPADLAMRALGLLAFQASAVLLAVLVARWHGRVVAAVALVLFEFLPFGLLWGASSLIDFASVALALLMVVGLDRWLTDRSVPWLLAGALGSVLVFLVKLTTVPTWGVLLVGTVLVLWRREGWRGSWRRVAIALVGPVVGAGLGLAWTLYADSVKRSAELTEFLTSSALRSWNFGSMSQRLDPESATVIADRIAGEMAGPALLGLLVALVATVLLDGADQRIRAASWLVGVVAGPLVFLNLYVVHSYYLIAVYPAVCAAIAVGGVWLFRRLPVPAGRRGVLAALALAGLFVTTAASPVGRADLAQFAKGNPRPALSSMLLDQTPDDARIVMIGCDWDPTFLYYAEREGLMFRGGDAGSVWTTEDIGDYDYLYNCRSGDLDPADYLPTGASAEPLGEPGFFRITRG